MQKLLNGFLSMAFLNLFVVSSAWAIDYSILSTQELYEFKGAVKNAPESEQKAYEEEWRKRLATMTEEEKKQYAEGTEKAGQNDIGQTKSSGKPFVPGRGYDDQGAGGVLYGGGSPVQGGK